MKNEKKIYKNIISMLYGNRQEVKPPRTEQHFSVLDHNHIIRNQQDIFIKNSEIPTYIYKKEQEKADQEKIKLKIEPKFILPLIQLSYKYTIITKEPFSYGLIRCKIYFTLTPKKQIN